MPKLGISVKTSTNPIRNSVTLSAEIERDYGLAVESLETRILQVIADKFIEEYGDEIIGMIDMDKLGKQINGKVLGAALKQLSMGDEA